MGQGIALEDGIGGSLVLEVAIEIAGTAFEASGKLVVTALEVVGSG